MRKYLPLLFLSLALFAVKLGQLGVEYKSRVEVKFLGYKIKGNESGKETATISFRVYNRSTQAAAKSVGIKVEVCGKELKKSLGLIGRRSHKDVSFTFEIPSSYRHKKITGKATAWDRKESSHSISFSLPGGMHPAFAYEIREKEGIKDGIYQPGEEVEVRYILVNEGDRPLFNVKVKDPHGEKGPIAVINPGESITLTYPVPIPYQDDSIKHISPQTVIVKIPILGDKTHTVKIKVTKYDVRMTLEGLYDRPGGLSSGNNNGELERDETIEAKVKVINKSDVTIRDAVLHMKEFEGIRPVVNDAPLEDLPPGKSTTASVSFYIDKKYNTRIPFTPVFEVRRGDVILSRLKIERRIKGKPLPAWVMYSVIGGGAGLFIIVILVVYFSRLVRTITTATPSPGTPTPTPTPSPTPSLSTPEVATRTLTDIGILSKEAQERYVLVREIGRGGMGVVYEARDTVLQRPVALKVMRHEIGMRKKARERFLKEARMAAKLNHPNIVTLYDVVEDESGQIFLVFEYVDGRNLSGIIDDKGKLEIPEVLNVSSQILSALSYAHSEGIIHRDLKPSNVMVRKDGRVKVLDFGIARVAYDTIYTFTGQTSGTPAYMAPEQHLGEKVDARTDIYAFGATLYEMVTGELPFKGADLLAVKQRKALVRPREINPDVPERLEEIILRCLDPSPSGRPENAEVLRKEIETIRGGGQ